MKNLLVITTLYPNSAQNRHGIFVETRLRHLLATKKVCATVIAPVPWFPIQSKWFPGYSMYARVAQKEIRHGVEIYHPRYLVIPKVGMLLTPLFLAISISRCVKKLRRKNLQYDLVDGHYFFPDGVAIALLSKQLGKPFVLTARGTDINLIPNRYLPRQLILWAARKAAASITVCSALKHRMVEIGAKPEEIHVRRNGVDLNLFKPLDRSRCREQLQLDGKTLLSVGHLIDRKGHDLVIKAMTSLPDCVLLIAGDGEREQALKSLVQELGLNDRVRFLGALTQQQLVDVYNATDIMVLASSREGWANVLLESMACGTPVVASSIWGTPEVVASPEAGLLFEPRTPEAIASSVRRLFANYPDRAKTRQYAELFSWDQTVDGLLELFEKVAA